MLSSYLRGKNVLVLGPHPDDEVGCAATIVKLVEAGAIVHHYFFSPCDESMAQLGLPPNQLLKECNQSREILGIQLANCGNFEFPVRYFPTYRQEILEELIKLKQRLSPALVFTCNSHDIHQDHHTIYEETIRAFKHTTVLGYEIPWNTMTMKHDCLIAVSESEIEKKIAALTSYKSQEGRIYANINFFQALAQVRGVQANTRYAECFELIRLVL